MAFGQSAGPPASPKEINVLLEALQGAGFDSFREARHPLGLTQRQANGKFTRGEIRELIDRLADIEAESDTEPEVAPEPAPQPVRRTSAGGPRIIRKPPAQKAAVTPSRTDEPAVDPDQVALAFPDELLAEELVRRGWTCVPPSP